MKQPHDVGLEEAHEILGGTGVELTPRQMKSAPDRYAARRQKRPFFSDPIEDTHKIEKQALINTCIRSQVQAEPPAVRISLRDDSKLCSMTDDDGYQESYGESGRHAPLTANPNRPPALAPLSSAF